VVTLRVHALRAVRRLRGLMFSCEDPRVANDFARALGWVPSNDGKGGRLRVRRTRAAFHLFAVVWNLVLPQVASRGPPPALFVLAGAISAAIFAYFLARSLWNSTLLRFDSGKFVCRWGPLPPSERFEHLIADIVELAVDQAAGGEGWKIVVVTRSAARLPIPVDLDGLVVVARGTNRALFGRARREEAQFVAERLNDALEIARRETVQYRVAGLTREPLSEEATDVPQRSSGASTFGPR
jgi:hypothetical protein